MFLYYDVFHNLTKYVTELFKNICKWLIFYVILLIVQN